MMPRFLETSYCQQWWLAMLEGNAEKAAAITAQANQELAYWFGDNAESLLVEDLNLPKRVKRFCLDSGIRTLNEIVERDWESGKTSESKKYLREYVKRYRYYRGRR